MIDVGAVLGVGADLLRQPRVQDLDELRLGRGAQAEREDVGVVPAARARRRGGVRAQRRADPGDLVRGDRGAGAGPAADDALLRVPRGDVAVDRLSCPGPI
jgi:hypothetical protein